MLPALLRRGDLNRAGDLHSALKSVPVTTRGGRWGEDCLSPLCARAGCAEFHREAALGMAGPGGFPCAACSRALGLERCFPLSPRIQIHRPQRGNCCALDTQVKLVRHLLYVCETEDRDRQ